MGVPSTDAKPPCSECGKPSISMCPYCKLYVHQGFGLHNGNCSGKHEAKCSGARWSRDSDQSKQV